MSGWLKLPSIKMPMVTPFPVSFLKLGKEYACFKSVNQYPPVVDSRFWGLINKLGWDALRIQILPEKSATTAPAACRLGVNRSGAVAVMTCLPDVKWPMAREVPNADFTPPAVPLTCKLCVCTSVIARPCALSSLVILLTVADCGPKRSLNCAGDSHWW